MEKVIKQWMWKIERQNVKMETMKLKSFNMKIYRNISFRCPMKLFDLFEADEYKPKLDGTQPSGWWKYWNMNS